MIERDVFHLRLKNMEIQAERLLDSRLSTRPIAIISSPHQNGTILSLSNEAKEEGLVIGMKVSLVRKMSQGTQLLTYNHSLYERINRYVFQSLSSFTPVIEPRGINEFFLDMNGMQTIKGDVQNTGLSIIEKIQKKTSLSGVIGISNNKLISRIVTAVVSDPIHAVRIGQESRFLSPLSPSVLPVTQEKDIHRMLKFLLINSVGQIQSMMRYLDDCHILFGVHSNSLDKESRGYDITPVRPPQRKDHIMEQIIIPYDTNDESIVLSMVKDISERIAFQLRQRKQIANRVRLEIHYADGHRSHRVGSFNSIDDCHVTMICKKLFQSANKRRNRIRSILLDIWGFCSYVEQINLFNTKRSRAISISAAIDDIRSKYGFKSIQNADVLQALISN
tara:strand:+ start:2918 stop:4090 length:1173 start_codon:yes stop_codon:yes gene_type:complete